MIDYSETNLSYETNPEEKFYLFLSNIIDFSMNHLGWYRLQWLDSIGGNPSVEVINLLHKPRERLSIEILKASDNKISQEKVNLIGDIIHSYLHGELCKWINNRNFVSNDNERKMMIFSNLKHLYKLLIQEVF